MKNLYRSIPLMTLSPMRLLRPLRLAVICLPALALASCASGTDTAETDPQPVEPSGALARKALLHNAPPPIKLLNAVGTVGHKVEEKLENKSETTTTTTTTTETTTPPQASL
jgi:hypothetical protein